MRFVLGALVILFNLMDNFTTLACLRSAVPGVDVMEANPVARWLFDSVGLFEGLVLEMLLTTAAVAFLVFSERLPGRTRLALLSVLAILPAWAAVNNMNVMTVLGISL